MTFTELFKNIWAFITSDFFLIILGLSLVGIIIAKIKN